MKDCPPFASLHRRDLAPEALAEWQRSFEEGQRLFGSGGFNGALQAFQRASAIDDRYAEGQFRLGWCHLKTGNLPEARRRLALARDLDTLRFRVDSRLNQITTHTAAGREQEGVYFLDGESVLASQSPDQVPGDALFFEHVHLNFKGNYLLARAFGDAVLTAAAPAVRDRPDSAWLSESACAERLAFTDWNRREVLQEVQARLRRPPFVLQSDHRLRMELLTEQIRALGWTTNPARLPEWRGAIARAVDRNPEDWEFINLLAWFFQQTGQLDEARMNYPKVLQHIPQSPAHNYQLGRLLNRGSDRSEAVVYLRQALRLAPYFAEAHNSLGIALAHMGQYEGAYEHFSAAVNCRPDYAEAEVNWGMVLLNQNRPGEAEQHYRSALGRDTNDAPAHLNLARVLEGRRQTNEALQSHVRAFALQPGDAQIRYQAARVAEEKGQLLQAAAHLAVALEQKPDHAEAKHRLGLVYARLDRLSAAESQFRATVALKPDMAVAHFDLGVALARQNRLSEATEPFEETLRLQPTNAAARRFLEEVIKRGTARTGRPVK